MSFPNTIQGNYADPYDTGSVRIYDLGQRMMCPNGRVFRYAEMGTIGVANKLYQSELPGANFDTLQIAATQTTLVSTTMTFTNGTTAITEDMFKFGYVCVEETSDLGENHRIYANSACVAGATGIIYLYPGDVIQTTVDTTGGNVITLVKSPYKDIIIKAGAADQTAMIIGIPPVVIAANAYGWVQTHGVASCVVEGTVLIAELLRASEGAGDGAVAHHQYSEAGAADNGPIGWCMEDCATTEFGHIFLTIEGLS